MDKLSSLTSTGFAVVLAASLASCSWIQPSAPVQQGGSARPAAQAQKPAAAPEAQKAAEALPDAPAPAPDAQALPSLEYRLGSGDVVKLSVYGNQDLGVETEVGRDGRISFPLIGQVKIGGLTKTEAERTVAQALEKGRFVQRAHVNLLVTQYRSRQVSVLGEVNKPGMYQLNHAMSVTDVLAQAGGISAKGSSLVTVIKKDANGGQQKHELDVRNLLSAVDAGKPVFVDANDIVFVPPAPVFYIYGEVRNPGSYAIAPEMTVQQALSVGGGLTPRGSERGIQLERKDNAGKPKTYRARPSDRLQANDVLRVPEGWF